MKKILSLILAASVILSLFVCIMPAFAYADPASDDDFGITYLWNDDFSDEASLSNYYTTYAATTYPVYNASGDDNYINGYYSNGIVYSHTTDGTVKLTGANGKMTYFNMPAIIVSTTEKLVVSYKFKTSSNKIQIGPRYTTSQWGSDAVYAYYQKGITAKANGAANATYYENTSGLLNNTWVDITLVLDPATDKRDIYINGRYYATEDTDALAGYRVSAGKYYFCQFVYFYGNTTVEFDDIKIYQLPSELKYKVKSISPESAVLEFNAVPTEYDGDDFEILNTDGTTATTVSNAALTPTNPREVTINFAEALNACTNYIIKPSGVKAGTNTGDVCPELSVSSSDTGVTVLTGRLDNSVYSDVLGLLEQNFESVDSSYLTPSTSNLSGENMGIYSNTGSTLSLENIDGIKALRMTQDAVTPMTRYILKKDYIPDDSTGTTAIAVEYRVRADFSYNADAMFDSRNGIGYGPHLPSIYKGGIYNNAVLNAKIASYNNNEWVTLTSVFKLNSDGTKVLRDTYIDGAYNSTYEADYTDADYGFLYGTYNLNLSFRVRDVYSEADTNGIVDIDYIRAYRIPATYTFGAEIVSDKTDSDVESVTLKFNNLIDTASLSNAKVTLKDGNNTVANVLYSEPIIEANTTGYALKAKLVLDNALDFNTEYDLYLDNVEDINGNKLIFKDSITTSSNKITSFTIEQSGTSYTASLVMTASDKALKLVIAAYTVTDNIEKMEAITSVNLAAGITSGEATLANVPEGAVVRAYLLDGFKPLAIK